MTGPTFVPPNLPPPKGSVPADPTATPPKSTGCGMGCLVLIGVIVVVGVLSAIFGSIGGGSSSTQDNSYEAKAQCEARIERLLKAPSTAEFDTDASGSGAKWTVTGTVDAENSFGAMIRAEFGCTVVVEESTATTTVDYFTG